MTKQQQHIMDSATEALDESLEEALLSLARAGLGPFYGVKLLLSGFGMSPAEAKRRVYASSAWQHMRGDIDQLHDDAEAALNEAVKNKSSGS